MTSIASRIPDILAYLVATFTAAPTLGAASPPVTVYDGPQTTESSDPLVLWVGLDDPDADGATLAAESSRDWGNLAAGQPELITIYCAAEAWDGTDDIAAQRILAFGVFEAVEALVAADATNFGGSGAVAYPGATGASLRQNNPREGAQARVSFQIVLKVL